MDDGLLYRQTRIQSQDIVQIYGRIRLSYITVYKGHTQSCKLHV